MKPLFLKRLRIRSPDSDPVRANVSMGLRIRTLDSDPVSASVSKEAEDQDPGQRPFKKMGRGTLREGAWPGSISSMSCSCC
ncbi:unnamed protein product [Lota lota]